MKSLYSAAMMSLAVTSIAAAQWESGSDDSDGAFNAVISTQVDLSLAATLCDCDGDTQVDDPCRWDCPSPVAGRGVYDAEQWVVVFKYTTVDVAAGATITFGMHPSGAPVAWLATGNVTITGRVNIDGEDGIITTNPPIVPYFTRPGPGGFQGAQQGHPGGNGASAYGLGPGSSPTQTSGEIVGVGGGASHATVAPNSSCNGLGVNGTGATYGTAAIVQLIGGSGGGAYSGSSEGGGGAGGGAILICSPTLISLTSSGSITAEGGNGSAVACGSPGPGGAGSGGAIRLRAETVTLSAGSQIVGRGGYVQLCGVGNCGMGANGRVRIEAGTLNNGGTINGSQSFPGAPSPVFAAAPPPRLYITTACGQSVPVDPMWGVHTTDVDTNSAGACTINIEGTGMPVGTIVVVRVIPARGNILSVNSTPMFDAGGGLRTATASVTFPAGRSEIQLRANW